MASGSSALMMPLPSLLLSVEQLPDWRAKKAASREPASGGLGGSGRTVYVKK